MGEIRKKLLSQYVDVFRQHGFEAVHGENSFQVVVNELQYIWIRPFDGKKSSATLYPVSKIFSQLYVKDDFRRKEIGFSEGKTPEQLFKDINKRIIEHPFCINQWNHLNEVKRSHDEYETALKNNIEKVRAVKLDFRGDGERLSLYLREGFGLVIPSRDSLTVELRSLPIDLGIEVLKTLERWENKK